MFGKSTHFQQVCQLLLSLIEATTNIYNPLLGIRNFSVTKPVTSQR